MKSLNYHNSNENKTRSFFIGLNILLVSLLIVLALQDRWQQALKILCLFTLGHALYWLWPRAFALLAHYWIKIAHMVSLLMRPLLLGICYFFILSPYALFYRLTHRDLAESSWREPAPELDFKDPF